MKTKRHIKLDPRTRTVTEVHIDGSLRSLYDTIECELVERVPLFDSRGQRLPFDAWIDEEGMINGTLDRTGAVLLRTYPYSPLAGVVLIDGGPDENGDAMPCPLSIEDVEGWLVGWATPSHLNEQN